MMACEHARGSTMGLCSGRGAPWNRASVKGACSGPSCSKLLRGSYKRGLHVFEGGQRRPGRFDASKEKYGGGGGRGSSRQGANPGDVALGHDVR